MERTLAQWQEEAAFLSSCHSRAASLFNTLFRSVGVCNIVFSATATSLSLNGSHSCEEAGGQGVLATLLVLTTISVGINTFFSWQVKRECHMVLAAEYGNIVKQIQLQLGNEGTVAADCAKWAHVFRELSMRSPLCPRWIVRKLGRQKRVEHLEVEEEEEQQHLL